MISLVRIALSRPYTFVVLALLLLIIGPLAALRTPTDIFPDIRIPVIGVVWNYTGLPPDQMAGRMITPFQRALTTTVNDIEHIVANSYNGIGIVKIFFQPNVDIRIANAQVTAISQTMVRQMPPGATPPLILNYSASTVPIIQVALSGEGLTEQNLADIGINQLRTPLVTVPGAAIPYPFGGKQRQVQIDLNPQALQARGLSGQDVANALAAQNLITPVGTQKIGGFEYIIQLNNSPLQMEELGNLPIKTVNGAMVYVRDVASVRDGNPPQTNIVHVDGNRSVLMMVLKAGSISTLDIIAGIKQKVIDVKDSLPDALKIGFIGDQSVFVRGAITGVAVEGVIAALLTSVMILLFLGSWRSTIIIAVSIPLSVLGAIVMLSAIGETLNIMTLGGLALAVGILVDDATVTIENINWHLEQGKDVETSILDGANQIVTPAFVSLLCICIVFVPMFFLQGVARFLFVPMAEAVMFAMIWSFLLSRTLVPTMAKYLLQPHVHHGEGEGPPPSRNPLVRFQRAFEARFERLRGGYRDLLSLAMTRRPVFVIGFLGLVGVSFLLVPYLGRNFFPSVDAGSILMHVRTQVGTRVEESANQFADVQKAIRKIIPPREIETLADNIGMPISGINMTYNNTGVIGPAGWRYPDQAEGGPPADRGIRAGAARTVAANVSRHDIRVPAGRHRQPDPEFRRAGADRPADSRRQRVRELRLRQQAAEPDSPDPRHRRRAHSAIAEQSDLQCRCRPHPRAICRADRTRRHQQPGRQPGGQRAGGADLLPQSGQWRVLFDRDADAAVQDGLAERAGDVADHGGRQPPCRRSSAASPAFPATASSAVVSQYDIQPMVQIYATPQGRDLGAVAADVRKAIADTATEVPKGSSVVLLGQVQTMNSAFSGLLFGLLAAVVLIYLLIVVNFQSWSDPFVIITALPAALAGIVWMLFTTQTTLSVPALTGAIMCMGVATANSVLVISFARERYEELGDPIAAAIEAGFVRFRPVLMTALAMIIGMAPMALGLGEGGEQNAPLGRAVIGGLIFATIATLMFVPVVFSMVHKKQGAKAAAAPETSHAH